MTAWQRRARLFVGISAVAFAIFLGFQFKRRDTAPAAAPLVRTDPGAVVQTLRGRVQHFELSRQNAEIRYEKQSVYADGSSKMFGVTIATEEKSSEGTFTATAKEATITKDQSTVVLSGDVRLASPSIRARAEHATYTKGDNTIRSPGPTEITEGKTTAHGIGMTFDRQHDILTIMEQAVVHMADENGGGVSEITCGTAVFNRRDRVRTFEKQVRMQRGGQLLEAETVVATLSADEKRVDGVELRENAKITASSAAVGALQELSGRNISLKYAASGESIEHAIVDQDAVVQLAGERGRAGRRIVASVMDITVAPDNTPTALAARENVQLAMPAEPDAPARTIRSATLDAKGEPGRGLSHAQFGGNVQYRESGVGAGRAASAATLDVGLKPGLSGIEDARFTHAVRFEEGKLAAQAAAARYDLDNGTLELSGSEPGALTPHVVNEQIAIDAQKLDVTLEGPKVKGTTKVKSVLQPAKKGQKPNDGNDVKLPAMLKQDEPVNVLGNALDYDGTESRAVYTGDARLFQGETSIKADAITIDDKSGDLLASGNVTSTTVLKDKNKPQERVRSVASAKDLKYEDAQRRLTYTGDAHLSNRDGDMQAAKIELYLKPSGDELDRAEAYDALTLKEQNRKTTGARMTYTADNEQYVITGSPVTIVDECGRETIGKTLTFLKSSDSIVVDGNQQIRTQTKSGGKCSS